ncbi:MAG TPA: hypothetical protein VJ860_05615 [Polyangia bacterium]|jgi:hypothetical protein|nr:hypothetical protein [Polyangia bacterium]
MTAASTSSCKGSLHFTVGRDAAVTPDLQPESRDTLLAADLAAEPDFRQATEAALPAGCTGQTVDADDIPMHGSISGPKFNGVVSDNGVVTAFLGTQGVPPYTQWFSSARDASGDLADDFLFDMPADVSSASLSGGVDMTTPEVGTYDSDTNCGSMVFEVSLPIPPGVFCPTRYGPCEPGCEPSGAEMLICEPAHPKLRYSAQSAAQCGSYQYPPRGDWQLTLTSVCPYVVSGTLINYQTHGHLTARFVNDADPSDSVVLNLDF